MQINTVTVIGANGTMGRNVAAIFAAFGNTKTYLVSRTIDKSKSAIDKAFKTVKAESIKEKMIAVDYDVLDSCIEESDLIFEACAENWELKEKIHTQIAQIMSVKENAKNKIVCTGTSGLSITKLAELYCTDLRERFVGMHFFNPPYNMTLCELIPTGYSSKEYIDEIYDYLQHVLFRATVITKDAPAFLGNRIGFQFINRLLQLAEEYKYSGGIDYIDAIFGSFTGRNMAPLVTANFVGLDVHKAIVDNLYENTDDYARNDFILPEYVSNLINNGDLGRKTGVGLYKNVVHDSGVKIHQVYDIEHGYYRETIKYSFPFVEEMVSLLRIGDYEKAMKVLINNHSVEADLCRNMLIEYIVYSLKTTELVGENIHSADDVMATGFGWCPPLALIEAFGGKDSCLKLCKDYFGDEVYKKHDIDRVFEKVENSKYDYRRFIKAKK